MCLQTQLLATLNATAEHYMLCSLDGLHAIQCQPSYKVIIFTESDFLQLTLLLLVVYKPFFAQPVSYAQLYAAYNQINQQQATYE